MPTPIPPDNNVVRYVRKRLLRRDETGRITGVLPQAFELREGEIYLSTTWLEHISNNYEAGFRDAANAVRSQLNVKPKDGFSAGCVEEIHSACRQQGARVRILHEPSSSNPGYSAIRQFPGDNYELCGVLADSVFRDTRSSQELV